MARGKNYRLEDKGLKLILRNLPRNRSAIVRKVAFDVQAHWITHMSANSPSAPGQPPAVVTGNLKNSSSVAMRNESTAEFRVGADYIDDLPIKARAVPAAEEVINALMSPLQASLWTLFAISLVIALASWVLRPRKGRQATS